MPEELRFNCSFAWEVSVDGDITLEQAPAKGGLVWRARAADRTKIAASFDIHEHVILIKKTHPFGKEEWTLRIVDGIRVVPRPRQDGALSRQYTLLTSGADNETLEPNEGIIAIDVEDPPGATVIIKSKRPPLDTDLRDLNFEPLPES